MLRERADDLLALGVWLPVSTLAAMRLRDAGVALDPLPLTPAELATALDAQPVLPAPASAIQGDPSAGDRAIRVRGLSVRRGGRRGPVVVHDVDLDVAAGDFVAIVGTNGAGKTSLLQAIAGVIPPPAGTVDVLGLDPARADARTLSRRIGFVFQNPEHQFVAHSALGELELGLRVHGVPEADRAEAAMRMLRRFGLEQLRDQHPFLLSGGQKRRLSVGTALIAGAPVLALDEPTFGQDRERAAELLDMLRALNRPGHDRAHRHARPAARRRLREPHRRHARRPHPRRRPHGRGARGPVDRARPGCGTRRSRGRRAASRTTPNGMR